MPKKDPAQELVDTMLQQAEQRRRAAVPIANLTATRADRRYRNSTGNKTSPTTIKDTFSGEQKIRGQIAQRRAEVLVVRKLKQQRGG